MAKMAIYHCLGKYVWNLSYIHISKTMVDCKIFSKTVVFDYFGQEEIMEMKETMAQYKIQIIFTFNLTNNNKKFD